MVCGIRWLTQFHGQCSFLTSGRARPFDFATRATTDHKPCHNMHKYPATRFGTHARKTASPSDRINIARYHITRVKHARGSHPLCQSPPTPRVNVVCSGRWPQLPPRAIFLPTGPGVPMDDISEAPSPQSTNIDIGGMGGRCSKNASTHTPKLKRASKTCSIYSIHDTPNNLHDSKLTQTTHAEPCGAKPLRQQQSSTTRSDKKTYCAM